MSERKLKGLLAPTSLQSKDTSHSIISVRKSASPSPSPTIASNSHKGTPNVKPHGTPVYYEIPGVQHFFYNPVFKNETDPQPLASPWVGSIRLKSLKDLPPVCQASANTAADTHAADQTGNPSQFDNDCSNSIYYLVQKLNIQVPSQPKNLEELLQRSFASMPSHSILQSPHGSAFPSPFIRSHTSTLMFQTGSVTDLSFKASFVAKSPFSASQTFKHKINSVNSGTTDEGLIMQIANLISKESDGRIKGAITDLLAQYSLPNTQQKPGLSQDEMLLAKGSQAGHLLSNGQIINIESITGAGELGFPKPKTISLSNGMKMNAVNRSPKTAPVIPGANSFKPNPQNTKIEAARKELFVISESAEKKSNTVPSKPETNDFNLFGAGNEPTPSITSVLSPLISSGSALKGGLTTGLFGQQQQQQSLSLMSQSTTQQTTSLFGNAGNNDNQLASIFGKKNAFELTGRFQASSTFKLTEDFEPVNQIPEINFANDALNKVPVVALSKQRGPNKKSRAKTVKKISMEDYVKHAHAQSIEMSNLTIDEAGEDDGSWDDIEPESAGKKKANGRRK